MGEGDLGGVVDDVVRVEAHAAREEALLERPHVAAVEALRQGERGERDTAGERRRGRAAAERGARTKARATRPLPSEGADLVHRDVDEGLHAALLGLGHRRVEQLVAGAEERVRERLVGPAGERGGGEAGDEAPTIALSRGEGRAQATVPAMPRWRRAARLSVVWSRRPSTLIAGVEGGEGPEERGPRGEALRGLGLEQEVDERLDDGAEEDHEGDVAQVGVAQEEAAGERRRRGAAGRAAGAPARVPCERRPRSPSIAEQEQDEQRGGAGGRHGARSQANPPPTPSRGRRAGADPPDHLPRRVGVEPLVDHRPEAGDERTAEGGDVQVEKDGGGPGRGEADRPPDGEQKRRKRGHRRDEAGGRRAGEARARAARPRRGPRWPRPP